MFKRQIPYRPSRPGPGQADCNREEAPDGGDAVTVNR
jgi:hypothetical protein